MKTLLAVLLLLSTTHIVQAQGKASITGRVKDSASLQGIPFATIVIINRQTKTPVGTIQTDSAGGFILKNIPAGVFNCTISYVGYNAVLKDNIVITVTTGEIPLGNILLTRTTTGMLNEVTVLAQTPLLKNSGGKKVFAVNQSLVSAGGTAADLLQNVPTLQVDANGNISLRGYNGVKVLVDGKPSAIGGGNTAEVLQAIPASAIERVEVITNPSAKYDAEGLGIINIVLKNNSKAGLNGNVAFTAGTRNNYNATASVSYQNSKVNVYGNYTYQHVNTYSTGFQNITYINPGNSIVFSNETFPSITINKGHIVKAGIDYTITPKNVLTLSGTVNTRINSRDELLSVDYLNAAKLPGQLTTRANTTRGNNNSYDISLDFNHQFSKPKEVLSFNFSYSHGITNNNYVYNTDVYNINGQPTANKAEIVGDNKQESITNYNLQADYILPIGKSSKLETGYRSQIRVTGNNEQNYNYDNATQHYIPNYNYTNYFAGDNYTHAIYLSYQQQVKNFTWQAGLRGEIEALTGKLQSYGDDNVLHYTPLRVPGNGLYPSLFLTQQFKNRQQLQFSYTRRVNRPLLREVIPVYDVSDPVNFEYGNPYLLPEKINSIELTYTKSWPKITLTQSLYYNQVNNVIKHVESEPVNSVVTSTSQNIQRAVNSGFEVIGSFNLLKGWEFITNTNVYYRTNAAAPLFGISATRGFSFNANITNNITIIKNVWLQVRADYKANDVLIQDRNHAAFGIDAAARYDFMHKKVSLSFTSRDIFNTRRWAFLRIADATLLDFERIRYSARASITLSYNFGKTISAPKKITKPEEIQSKRIDGN